MLKKIAILLVMSLCLSACATSNEGAGAITGATLGGLLGSRFGHGSGRAAAVAGGLFLGAVVGSQIGRSMDKTDRMEMARALDTADTGDVYRWRNTRTDTRYEVRPRRDYYEPAGQRAQKKRYCREYTTTAMIGGREQQVFGKACRMPDGAWKVVA